MVLVIGGDNLGSIEKNLRSFGFDGVQHVKGRNQYRLEITADTELILVLVDFVNHNLAKWAKSEARALNLPIVFSRRSWSTISESLQSCYGCQKASSCRRFGA